MSTKSSTSKASVKSAPSKKPAAVAPAAPQPKKQSAPPKKVEKEVTEDEEHHEEDKKERKRREVNKESVDEDFQAIQSRIESEITRLRESSEKVRGIKFLRSVNKSLKVLHSDTKRVMKLKKKNNRKKTVVSGFLKPIKISSELASFTGWDVNGTYSRVNVTKFICDYIKSNGLFNQDDKRLILVDDKLKTLLKYDPEHPPKDKDGTEVPLNYFRLQKYLKPHFVKFEESDEKQVAQPKEEKAKKAQPKPKSAPVVTKKSSRRVVMEEDVEEDDLDE